MDIHRKFHEQSQFKKEHFEPWLLLFQSNLDELFSGPNAEKTKQRAQSIAMVMELKFKGN
jgi:hemoglobin